MKSGNAVRLGARLRENAFSPARVLVGVLAVIVLQVALVPSASAGSYTVFPCNGKSSDVTTGSGEPLGLLAIETCNQPGSPGITLGSATNRATQQPQSAFWLLETPSDLSLQEVSMNLAFAGAWATTPVTWEVVGDVDLLERAGNGGTRSPSGGPVSFTAGIPGPGKFRIGTKRLRMRVICLQGNCPGGAGASVLTDNLRVVFSDESSPSVVDFGGTMIDAAGGLQGTKTVTIDGHDLGSGVASSEVLIDGNVVSTVKESNGGRCKVPFEVRVPCAADVNATHQIDTTTLADGVRLVAVRVCDASGNCTERAAGTATIRNAPTNSVLPTLTGTAKVGSTLESQTGTWQGQSLQFSHQWLRCPTAVTKSTEAVKCTAISGAVGAQYVPVKADVGQRVMVKVTAALPGGARTSASAFSDSSDVVSDLPAAAPAAPVGAGAPPTAGPKGNPPQTLLKKRPRKKAALGSTTFTFVSNQAGSRFECKLDKKAFRACGSTFKKKLKPGAHVFSVRAVNSAGQVDATPAVFRWSIKPI